MNIDDENAIDVSLEHIEALEMHFQNCKERYPDLIELDENHVRQMILLDFYMSEILNNVQTLTKGLGAIVKEKGLFR